MIRTHYHYRKILLKMLFVLKKYIFIEKLVLDDEEEKK